MNCFICHGVTVEAREVQEEIALGKDIVRVPLTVPVCATCGERYYDRPTMQRLELLREKLRSGNIALKEVGKVLACELQEG